MVRFANANEGIYISTGMNAECTFSDYLKIFARDGDPFLFIKQINQLSPFFSNFLLAL